MARNRYDRSLFYEYNEDLQDFDSLLSPFEDGIRALPILGEYQVTDATKNAIDKIAKDIYDEDELWWVLVEYNSIEDIFNLDPTQKIYYPSIDSIDELLYSVASSLNNFEV